MKLIVVFVSASVGQVCGQCLVDERVSLIQVGARMAQPNTFPTSASKCDDGALASGRRDVQRKDFDSLDSNPCVSQNEVRMWREGKLDIDDAWEVFGTGRPPSACQKRLLPKLMFLGMGHTGSTSLAHLLDSHSEVSYGDRKEHRFFTSFGTCAPKLNMTSRELKSEYSKKFNVDCNTKITFDATPSTFRLASTHPDRHPDETGCFNVYDPGRKAVRNFQKMLGHDMKFIFMVRSRADILESKGNSPKEDIHPGEPDPRCYAHHIAGWLEAYPREQFLFLQAEDYFKDPNAVLAQVFHFIGVSPRNFTNAELHDEGQAGRRRTSNHMWSPNDRAKLLKEDAHCNRKVRNLTGVKLIW